MDIAALSMAMSTSKLQQEASIAILSKTLDTAETTGEGMIKIMEQSVTPNLGNSIDISI